MLQAIKHYLVTLIIFFLIDLAWLGLIASKFYKAQIGFLMKTDVNWTAAVIFYLLFISGLLFFVLNPALTKDSLKYAVLAGGFFGLITYSTYDLTNLATLKNWPLLVTLVDLAWGTVVSALTAGVSFMFIKTYL